MGPKRFYSQNFSLFIVKFKKLGFSAPLMLFPTLGPSTLPVVVAQPDEGMQTEQLLCWSGMADTEHSTTSGSNEEDLNII